MATVVVEREVECQSDVIALWELITDTDRLNRAIGMDKIELTPLDDDSAARYLVSTKIGGIPVEYEERPYEWVYPQSFKVLRPMRSGPFRSLEMAFFLRPGKAGGSVLTLRLTVELRVAFMSPVVKMMCARTISAFAKAASELDRTGKGPASSRSSSPALDAELARAAKELAAGEHREIAARLLTFVREEDDAEVSRMRPFELAERFGLDRRAVLAGCLAAVRAGLLTMRWEIICPSCRTATDVLPSLSDLREHGACQLCEIDFDVDLEQAVEATFAPNAAVRPADSGPYCIGGPARTPHVVSQAVLPAHAETRLACPTEPGRYRFFVRGGANARLDVEADAPAEVKLDASNPSFEPIVVGAGGALVIKNPGKADLHAKIERVVFGDLAARAQVVTSMPGFRRDFSSDVLRPGMALKVARVGIFFSDLTGSTELYANAGDAAAFKLVLDHFELVVGLVERHGGGLVKTIGDAVMAVFADDVQGLVASVAMLEAFETFREGHDVRQRTHIKLGVFGGPCYVVTANGILDYFGHSVNVAARMQGEAKSGELVVEEDLANRAIAQKKLDPRLVVERYAAKMKGVPDPLAVVRIRVR